MLHILNMVCPYCVMKNNMLISITKQIIKIECKNQECMKVFRYVLVSIGNDRE